MQKILQEKVAEGWTVVVLENYVDIHGRIGWKGLKKSEYTTSGPVFLAVKDIKPNGEIDFSDTGHISKERYEESPEIQLRLNDIILTKDGTIGKVGMVNELPFTATVNSSLLVVRPSSGLLLPRFLFHYLRGPQFQDIVRERITGSGVPHLFQKDIKKLQIVIPPLNEQRKIISKLEKIFLKQETSMEALKKIKHFLNQYRQSLLKSAYQGKITKNWREKNAGRLTSVIDEIKNKKIKQKYVSKNLSKNDKSKFEDLPSSWEWVTLDLVSVKITDGEHIRPKITQKGIPFLSAKDVREEGVVFDDTLFVNATDAKKFRKRCNPEKGDLLVVSRGATVGRGCIVNTDKIFCLLGSVILIKLLPEINSEFVSYLMKYRGIQDQLLNISGATAQPAIYLRDIQNLVLPCPPREEQEKIVSELKSRYSLITNTEKIVKQILEKNYSLNQSILKYAFKGKLSN